MIILHCGDSIEKHTTGSSTCACGVSVIVSRSTLLARAPVLVVYQCFVPWTIVACVVFDNCHLGNQARTMMTVAMVFVYVTIFVGVLTDVRTVSIQGRLAVTLLSMCSQIRYLTRNACWSCDLSIVWICPGWRTFWMLITANNCWASVEMPLMMLWAKWIRWKVISLRCWEHRVNCFVDTALSHLLVVMVNKWL